MDNETRYHALVVQHHRIDLRIAAEMKRPLPGALQLQRLKRQKLLLKDEIESWERLIGALAARPTSPAGASRAQPVAYELRGQ